MTAQTAAFVKLEGTKARTRRLMHDVSGRAQRIVRGNAGTLYIQLPSSELGWIDKVAGDIGVRKVEVQQLPVYFMAPCGVFTVNVGNHKGQCKKCQAILRKPHDGEVKTVAKVEGLQSMDINSLIAVMKQRADDALSLAQEYDSVIKALEKIPELQKQLESMAKQLDEHRQAIKCFTSG